MSVSFVAPRQWIRRLLACDRGALTTVFACLLPVLIGVVGLAGETAVWYEMKRRAQTAADAAAVAGAFQRARGDTEHVILAGKRAATQNGFTDGASSARVTVHNPPSTGAYVGQADAVEAVVTKTFTPMFSRLFHSGDVSITARAVAEVKILGSACVLALSRTASNALSFQGTTRLDNTGCVLASNSGSAAAVAVGGLATVRAQSIWAVGSFDAGLHQAQLALAFPPATNMWPLDDPYAGIPIGAVPACLGGFTSRQTISTPVTLSPGTYCGGLELHAHANVTLQPGTYYFDGGSLSIHADATLSCNCAGTSGVTLVLTNTATPSSPGTIRISHDSTVSLQAPNDGSIFSGIVIYQDPASTVSRTNHLDGGSGMMLRGSVYLPKQDVQFSGDNALAANTCLQIIASTVTFIGTSTIYNTACDEAGVRPMQVKGVRLRE